MYLHAVILFTLTVNDSSMETRDPIKCDILLDYLDSAMFYAMVFTLDNA
jgi:hypothetical protein